MSGVDDEVLDESVAKSWPVCFESFGTPFGGVVMKPKKFRNILQFVKKYTGRFQGVGNFSNGEKNPIEKCSTRQNRYFTEALPFNSPH